MNDSDMDLGDIEYRNIYNHFASITRCIVLKIVSVRLGENVTYLFCLVAVTLNFEYRIRK